ncbi:MAG: SDR family oxidoreductase [Firmicutes bacterium]|nr:SDR family oxidoreductase [Bacillota bacterium]
MAQETNNVLDKLGLDRDSLSGQVAVVTGAGRGIGRVAAHALAWFGARIIVAEISEVGEETASAIRDFGGHASFVRADISSQEDVAHLAAETHRVFGYVDILVNNAIICPVASVLETEVRTWDRVMSVNLRGPFMLCKEFLPDMLSRGHGVIINMTTAEAMPYLSAYVASKQGLAALSQSLAAEVAGRGVRVVALGVGMVDTPGLLGAARELAPRLGMSYDQFIEVSLHPAYQGLMPPEHAGAAVAYLASALADEYHGDVVTGYEVLERAGVIEPAQEVGMTDVPSAGPAQDGGTTDVPGIEPAQEASVTEVSGADRASATASGAVPVAPGGPWSGLAGKREDDGECLISQAIHLAVRLRAVIADTEEDFAKLPVFVRPLAKRGFRAKAALSIHEWQDAAGRLERVLAQAVRPEGSDTDLGAECVRIAGLLGKLAAYYEQAPAETARFTRDPATLAHVRRIMGERLEVVRSLAQTLGEIERPRSEK